MENDLTSYDSYPHHHISYPAYISVLQKEIYLEEHRGNTQGQSNATV